MLFQGTKSVGMSPILLLMKDKHFAAGIGVNRLLWPPTRGARHPRYETYDNWENAIVPAWVCCQQWHFGGQPSGQFGGWRL